MGKTSDAVLAYIEKQVGKAQYSRTFRMKKGYYDCSSIVYRAYKAAGITLRHKDTGKPISTSCYEVYAGQFELLWPKRYRDIGKKLPTASKLLPSLNLQGGEHIFMNFNKDTGRKNRITHVCTVRKGGKGIVHARNPRKDVCHDALTYGARHVCAVVRYKEPKATDPAPAAAGPSPGAPKPEEKVVIKRVLKRLIPVLMKGGDVLSVQTKLKTLGFDPHGLDGKFGKDTKAAVIAFQKSAGIAPDGKVGRETAEKLGFIWKG